MKLKEIRRTSTFAWSPTATLPLLATGTVAGALDESFSNESQLELWSPNFLDKDEFELGGIGQSAPAGVVTDTARFNRLAWGAGDGNRSHGVIAAGMENGELALWDPAQILAGAGTSESLILRNTTHTGPIRGLDFNPIQTSLLASGGVNGEVYIWDLKDPSKPYTPTPGARSNKLDEITSISWNQQVQYVLAGASSTGYTVVWDLRGKREVVALAYGGGAGTHMSQLGSTAGLAVGGRRGMSDIAWHPDNATRLVTASEDDSSPVIMVWDLRNARAPEKILTGHEKGVLSLSWCKQDADLLLSCGKDNRVLCWNPQTSDIIGEIPSADNWAFQVDWNPRNPDLLAAAFFDGTVGIHSTQATNESTAAPPPPQGADIFDTPAFTRSQGGSISLKQTPKWLCRPASSSFGFGGRLVTISNLPSAQGRNQSSVIHIRSVVTEDDLVERAGKLQAAVNDESLQTFAETKTSGEAVEDNWKALLSLFKANSRDELVTLLGFSKDEIAARVGEAVQALKNSGDTSTVKDEDIDGRTTQPVVSFAEPERQVDEAGEKTPSEVSASVTSESTSVLRQTDRESTTTVPSLFGDDADPGTPDGADFFNTIGTQNDGDVVVPHTNYGLDSSVAATMGSRPSSAASESFKANSFRIYPADESETDRLVTKALVLGDFESAVSLCISSDRFADAILLAVRGGPELLAKTQKAYFEKRTQSLPYLRLFQSIVTNDLADIVQNADLQEWQEIFVVICTFATQEEFPTLAEQLGRRLEYQFTLEKDSEDLDVLEKAIEFRKNATLTYLAAARLERLVSIWADELIEEEEEYAEDESKQGWSHYSTHAHALQTFVEKVTVFRSATKYDDDELSKAEGAGVVFKLSSLYDKYLEYAELLASQGLLKEASTFLRLIPLGYKNADLDVARDRIGGTRPAAAAAATPRAPAVPTKAPATTATTYNGYTPYGGATAASYAPAVTTTTQARGGYTPYAPAQPTYNPPAGHYAPLTAVAQTSAYAPPAPNSSSYAPVAPTNNAYNLTQPPHLRQQTLAGQGFSPAPQRPSSTSQVPPPRRTENGGWNDPPPATSRTPAALDLSKPHAITSPFPNVNPVPTPAFPPAGSPFAGQQGSLPPPPRPGSVQRGPIPPPPRAGSVGPAGFPGRPPSSAANPMHAPPPPSRLMSPPHQPQHPTPNQYAPPLRGPTATGQTPPPGPGQYRPPPQPAGGYALPPQQQHHQPPPPSGPYAPPPQQQQPPPGQYAPPPGQQTGHYGPQQGQQTGPYAPPPGQQQPGPYAAPPAQQTGPYAPPPGQSRGPPPPGGPGGPLPGGPGGPGGPPPPRPASSAAAVKAAPPPPKYPPGDRSHIPDNVRPAYNVILDHLMHLKQTTPPSQKRLVDDLERRINPLFDALNCETLSQGVVEQLIVLTRAMEARDRQAALQIHLDLLTRGSQTDDIALWMSGVKQLLLRL